MRINAFPKIFVPQSDFTIGSVILINSSIKLKQEKIQFQLWSNWYCLIEKKPRQDSSHPKKTFA